MKKRPQHKKQTSPADNRAKIEYTALLPFLAILLLLLIGSFQKSYYFWGISAWSVIDSGLALSVLVGGLALILLLLTSPIRKIIERLVNQTSVIVDRTPRFLSVTLISILLFSLFYSLRSKALIYGDGFQMLDILSSPASSEITGKGYLQILSTIFNRTLIELLTSTFLISAEKSFAIINITGGIIGFWALIGITRKLADNPSRRIFLLFAAISSGATLLFFGHIENYVWPIVLSLWSLNFLIKYLCGEAKWMPMTAFAILAFLFHAITGPMLVLVLLAVSFVKNKNAHKVFGWSHGASMVFVTVALFLFIAVWQLVIRPSAPNLPGVFVTLWPIADNLYWSLSLSHLIDIFNLLFFLAPVGIILSLYLLIFRKESGSPDATERILAWLTLLTLLEIFWIDPELGAPRDWDLMAIAGFPLSLWAAYRFSSTSFFKSGQAIFAAAAIVVTILHLGPHIYEKSNTEVAVERLDALLWDCPHYQTTYNEAYRGLSWGTTLNVILSRDDLAEKYFKRRITVNESSSSWFNLSQIYHGRGDTDSTAICLTKAVELAPENAFYLVKLADVKYRQNKIEEALELVNRSEALDSVNTTLFTTKAIVLFGLGRVSEALNYFNRAHKQSPDGFDQNFNLGAVYYSLSDYEKAYPFLKRAIAINKQSVQGFERLIPVQLKLGKTKEAEATLAQYRQINPKAGNLEYYRKVLKD